MKRTIKFLAIIIGIGMSGCTNLETDMMHTKRRPSNEQVVVQVTPPIEQNNEILSKDYTSAQKALEKAVSENNKNIVRLGLKSPILTIRQNTVKAISSLDDETFVPDLIDALADNQVMLEGGTETKILQGELSEAIIVVLEQLTDLKFQAERPLSSENIDEIIKKSRDWCKASKLDQDNNILSGNHTVAEKALEKAVLEKDKNTIRLGLKSPIFSIKQKTTEAMAEIKDNTFVPDLIEALQDNQGVLAGGSEAQILQNELNKAIIFALERITKLEFNVSKRLSSEDIKGFRPFSSEEIQDVMDKTSDWCKANKNDM